MAAKFPISISKLPTLPRLPLPSTKESKLKFTLKPRPKNGIQGEATTVELTFCTPISKQKYTCILCQCLLRDPCQVTCCGSNFCKDCVDHLSATTGKCANKNCRKNYSVITDGSMVEELRKKIMQMKVYCALKNSGCKWMGTIDELESSHFTGSSFDRDDDAACQFQYVNCPNKCGTSIPRRKVMEHCASECDKELSMCKYCGVEDLNIHKIHHRMCPSVPVECPNKCATPGIARSQILFHLENECPLRLVSCKYRHVGCEEEVRFINLEEHNTTAYQKHLDLMSEKLVFVSNENEELRGDNDNHQKSTTMLFSKLDSFQQGLATIEDILGCYNEMKAFHGSTGRNVYSTSSTSSDAVFKELPPKDDDDDDGMCTSVFKELSGKISFQSKLESSSDSKIPEASSEADPVYVNVPSKRTNGKKSKVQTREILPDVCADVPQLTINEVLSSSSGDTTCQQDVGSEDQVRSSDKSKRRLSDPNIPSLFGDSGGITKKKASRSISLPKENENVELLVYRQISNELSLPSIVEGGSGNTSPAPPLSTGDEPETSTGPSHGQTSMGPRHDIDDARNSESPSKSDQLQPRSVTFRSSVEVISNMTMDFGNSVSRTTPASSQQDGITEVTMEEDIFSPQAHPTYSLVSRKITTKVGSNDPSPSEGMRPRSHVISESSFDSYNPKISEAVRARSQSAGTRRRTPPLPPTAVEPGEKSSLLSVPSKTGTSTSNSSDTGLTTASVESPQIEISGVPTSISADLPSSQAAKMSDSSSNSMSFSAKSELLGVSSHASSSAIFVSSHSSSHHGLLLRPLRWLRQVRHHRANSPQP